jgi:hypothetical protein
MTAVPTVGKLYTCREQSAMHGGNIQRTAPDRDGKITLLRVRPEQNPDAPQIIDWAHPLGGRKPDDERVHTLKEQHDPLPFYLRRGNNQWEYMGLYRVADVTSYASATAERSRIVGLPIRYVIRLRRVSD